MHESDQSTLGPEVGGPSNREKSFTRDLCVSAAMRRIPDVRVIDIDFVVYDPLTKVPEIVVEASSDPRKASTLARRFAKQMDAYCILLIHRYNDNAHKHPVTVSCWAPDGLKIVDKQEITWVDFLTFMRTLHDMHREWIVDRSSLATIAKVA